MTTLEFWTFTGSVATIIVFGFVAWYQSGIGR
jgi:hypothetical protein